MVIAVTTESAIRTSLDKVGKGTIPPHRVEYIGVKPDQGGEGQPQAFIVKMKPNQEFGSHYHTVPQYQLILAGDGYIGKQPLQTYAIHYTDGYTGYGPLISGENAMQYMTLRAESDPGPQYIDQPGAHERMKASRRRFLQRSGIRASTREAALKLTSPLIEPLYPEQDDGVASVVLRLGPGMRERAPDPSLGGGYFLVVIRGRIELDGMAMNLYSTLFVGSSEKAPLLVPGSEGVDLLFMQFPRAAATQ